MWHHIERSAERLKGARANLRQNMPAPEAVLWQRIRAQQLGVRFRRQYSIGGVIVDFYAPAVRLAIEVDGESHYVDSMAQERDHTRDAVLARDRILVLRFTNLDVMRNAEGVVDRIRSVVRERLGSSAAPHPPATPELRRAGL